MLRKTIVSAFIALTLAASTATPTAAIGGFCMEPHKPYCVNSQSTYDNDYSFSSCRSQVQTYIRSVNSYVDCLRDEQRSAIAESNKVVDYFNCKAKGGNFCY